MSGRKAIKQNEKVAEALSSGVVIMTWDNMDFKSKSVVGDKKESNILNGRVNLSMSLLSK